MICYSDWAVRLCTVLCCDVCGRNSNSSTTHDRSRHRKDTN